MSPAMEEKHFAGAADSVEEFAWDLCFVCLVGFVDSVSRAAHLG